MSRDDLLWHPVRGVAEARPDATALVTSAGSIDYGTLMARARGVGCRLADHGVGRGDRVGLLLPKGIDAIVGLFGAWMAGSAYVPVDPSQPGRRSATILEDAGVRAVVTDAASFGAVRPYLELPDLRLVLVAGEPSEELHLGSATVALSEVEATEESPGAEVRAGEPAYVLYTSGSTGSPKGVVHTHASGRAFVDWAVETFDLGPGDRLSAHAALSFDLSTFDFFAGLAAGASVHPVPDRIRPFPASVAAWIAEQELTTWYSVPTALAQIAELDPRPETNFDHLRRVLFAGEVFPLPKLRETMAVFPSARFHNLFGPTETNVCTHYPVPRPLPEGLKALPIGEPCCGDVIEIQGSDGSPLEDGHVGELVVGGPTVMKGYLGRPEADAMCFGDPLHPFDTPSYRTGDMVARGADGLLRYSGRRDSMVKIRGYRIELGEIEQILAGHERIAAAAVVAPTEGGQIRLAAYLVGSSAPPSQAEIRRWCLERVPRHAVPEHFVFLPGLPLTDRGKVDRRRLTSTPLPRC